MFGDEAVLNQGFDVTRWSSYGRSDPTRQPWSDWPHWGVSVSYSDPNDCLSVGNVSPVAVGSTSTPIETGTRPAGSRPTRGAWWRGWASCQAPQALSSSTGAVW